MRWLVAFVPACFSPNPPTGAPCMTDRDCPSPQVCDPATDTCQLASTPGSDSGVDPDSSTDSPTDGDPPSIDCWALWKAGTPTLSAPTPVVELNSDKREQDPVFTPDGLTVYFVSADVISRATRPSFTAPFGTIDKVDDLDPAGNQSRVTLTADGNLAIFESRQAGGEGGADLWQATKSGGTFQTATQTALAQLNDGFDQFDPELTADGLRLYYTTFNGPATIMLATRASIGDPFGVPVAIETDLPPGTLMFDPSLSPDELVLVFGTPSNVGPNDVHFATRASRDDPFVSRGKLTMIDSAASNGDADVSNDGCSLIFGSDRVGGLGNRDLWISNLQ